MRTKKVTRYYCDHCGRGALVKKAMERHEPVCYMNKERKCHACFNREEHKPRPIEERPSKIKAEGVECPHCLMASVVQYNKAHPFQPDEDGDQDTRSWYDLNQFRNDQNVFSGLSILPL